MSAYKTFLITGGTGLVGRRLTELLLAKGYEVKHLSRSQKSGGRVKTFVWSVEEDYVDPEALADVDIIVHLAGAPIMDGRWSETRKRELVDSRVKTLDLLRHHLAGSAHNVKTLISSSAQGFYEPNTGRVLHEDEAPDAGWMGQLCAAWEDAAMSWSELDVRVVIDRIGLVLSPRGGVLEAIMGLIHKRLSPVFGSGSQMYSWIHIDDFCGMIIRQAEDANMSGIFNAAAPNPVHQREFNAAIAAQLGSSVLTLRAPKFLLKAALGERAAVVEDSYNLSSDKVHAAGYDFQYKTISQAVADLI